MKVGAGNLAGSKQLDSISLFTRTFPCARRGVRWIPPIYSRASPGFLRQLLHSVVANILIIQKADAEKSFSTACPSSGKFIIFSCFWIIVVGGLEVVHYIKNKLSEKREYNEIIHLLQLEWECSPGYWCI